MEQKSRGFLPQPWEGIHLNTCQNIHCKGITAQPQTHCPARQVFCVLQGSVTPYFLLILSGFINELFSSILSCPLGSITRTLGKETLKTHMFGSSVRMCSSSPSRVQVSHGSGEGVLPSTQTSHAQLQLTAAPQSSVLGKVKIHVSILMKVFDQLLQCKCCSSGIFLVEVINEWQVK